MTHRKATTEAWEAVADQAKEIIRRRCREPGLRIDNVAKALSVSRRKLQRALRHVGTDFTTELMEARMARAAELLARQFWVEVAGAQSGYPNPSHFTVAFRNYYGVNPRRFRRAARLDERLKWRAWRDKVHPVVAGTSEYFRRRRRWRDDERELHRLIRAMPPAARAALKEHAAPERPVLPLATLREAERAARADAWRARLMDDPQAHERVLSHAWDDDPAWDDLLAG